MPSKLKLYTNTICVELFFFLYFYSTRCFDIACLRPPNTSWRWKIIHKNLFISHQLKRRKKQRKNKIDSLNLACYFQLFWIFYTFSQKNQTKSENAMERIRKFDWRAIATQIYSFHPLAITFFLHRLAFFMQQIFQSKYTLTHCTWNGLVILFLFRFIFQFNFAHSLQKQSAQFLSEYQKFDSGFSLMNWSFKLGVLSVNFWWKKYNQVYFCQLILVIFFIFQCLASKNMFICTKVWSVSEQGQSMNNKNKISIFKFLNITQQSTIFINCAVQKQLDWFC